jgi:hypothetical protein
MKKTTTKKKFITALFFFLYVTLGYWLVMFAINPKKFCENILDEFWILPIGLVLAIFQYFRASRVR